LKLKKASTVKRELAEVSLEKVELKHHEFEREPVVEEVMQLFCKRFT
jgi:hypothetical protein